MQLQEMEIADLEEVQRIYSETFSRHISAAGNDLVLLTLKGHLLIENALCALLEELIPNTAPLNRNLKRFDFKLDILQALITPPAYILDYVEGFRRLNNARNHLAHDLEASQFEEKLRNFVRSPQLSDFRASLDIPPGELADEVTISLTHLFVSCYVERNIRRSLREQKIAIMPD